MSRRLVHETSMAFHRYLLPAVNWGNRLICLKGAKGTGRTTFLLQHIRESFGEADDKCLFVSLDNIWFAAHDVIDLADWHWKHGGTHLFLDEVHHLRSWQTVIKNIYDSYPSLNIVYTGSSLLQLESKGGDLSRLRVPYTLPCLSFRENQVLEIDYPQIEDVSTATIIKAKKMLMVLAESVPQTPRMAQLYRELETDRNQGLKILKALARAGLLQLLSSQKVSLKDMSRPEKIFLDNVNLMHALVRDVDTGCARETFFLNQLRSAWHDVTYPAQGDFLVDGKWLFEVGGKGKKFAQIADVPDSFVVADDIEVGYGSKIPLWLFGFLY